MAKYGRAHKTVQRNLDRSHQKEHVPISDRELDIAPPVVIVVMGPKGVGKSTLIKAWARVYLRGVAHCVTYWSFSPLLLPMPVIPHRPW